MNLFIPKSYLKCFSCCELGLGHLVFKSLDYKSTRNLSAVALQNKIRRTEVIFETDREEEDPTTKKGQEILHARAVDMLYLYRWGGAKIEDGKIIPQGLPKSSHAVNKGVDLAISEYRKVAVMGDESTRAPKAKELKTALNGLREYYSKDDLSPSLAIPNSPYIARGRNQLRHSVKMKLSKIGDDGKRAEVEKLYWLSTYVETGRLFQRNAADETVLSDSEKEKLPGDVDLDKLSRNNVYFVFVDGDIDEDATNIKVSEKLIEQFNNHSSEKIFNGSEPKPKSVPKPKSADPDGESEKLGEKGEKEAPAKLARRAKIRELAKQLIDSCENDTFAEATL